jgi:hypothetical protein
VITHCAWLLEPPAGSCNELPAGHEVGTAADADDMDATEVEMLAPVRAISPMAADTIVPVRTPCCRNLFEIRTSPPQ